MFEAAPGAFKVTLYNMNVNDSKVKNANSIPLMKETKINTIKIKNSSIEADLIINAVRKSGSITRKDAESILGSGQTKAYRILDRLVKQNKLVQIKAGRKTIYQLSE